jgi:hypothetical protein
MRMRYALTLAAMSMAMSAGLLVGSPQAAGPVLPQLPALEGANQVEPAHWRRYRHCHRRVEKRCWGWRNRHCRRVVTNYCHRR